MKTQIFALTFLVVAFNFSAIQAIPVQDPHNILSEVDSFLGPISFSDAFHCGDKSVTEHNECKLECKNGATDCQETCLTKYSTTTVTVCHESDVIIETQIPNEDLNMVQITKEAYDAHHGNILRYTLAMMGDENPESFVSIESATPIDYRLPVNSADKVIKGIAVNYTLVTTLENGQTMQLPIKMTLGKDIPVIGQMLEASLFDDFFKTPSTRIVSIERKN